MQTATLLSTSSRIGRVLSLSVLLLALLFTADPVQAQDNAAVRILHSAPDVILDQNDGDNGADAGDGYSADPIDVYFDVGSDGSAEQTLDNVAFVDISDAVSLSDGGTDGSIDVTIAIAPANSGGIGDTLSADSFTLDADSTYLGTVFGVDRPASYQSNPDTIATGLQTIIEEDTRPSGTALTGDSLALRLVNGSPEASTIAFVDRDTSIADGLLGGENTLDSLAYTEVGDYVNVDQADFDSLDLAVVDPTLSGRLLASFEIDATMLDMVGNDSTAYMVLTGFLNPDVNPTDTDTDGADLQLVIANEDTSVTLLPNLPAAPKGLTINEVFPRVPDAQGSLSGDADNNGEVDQEADQFVEIVNRSGDTLAAGGYEIHDAQQNTYVFPDSVVLADSQAAVIFGSTVSEDGTVSGVNGYVARGLPNLEDPGDQVVLLDADGDTVQAMAYGNAEPTGINKRFGDDPDFNTESVTRSPEFAGSYLIHSTAAGQAGITSSPGLVATADEPLPVEFASAPDYRLDDGDVVVTWRTLSEKNNSGFYVESRAAEGRFRVVSPKIASKAQGGSSTEALSYRFRVNDVEAGTHTFRIRQVDRDGQVGFSPTVEVAITPNGYALKHAYPSPFRTKARIDLSVESPQNVEVTLYNALGQKVMKIHEGRVKANETFVIDGSELASGVYFYRVKGETFSTSGEVVLVK